MPDIVGITIHHQERVLPAREDQMLGVVARARGRGEKIRIRPFLLEIFDPPWAPERFDFGFRKLHQVFQSEASLQIARAKSSRVLA